MHAHPPLLCREQLEGGVIRCSLAGSLHIGCPERDCGCTGHSAVNDTQFTADLTLLSPLMQRGAAQVRAGCAWLTSTPAGLRGTSHMLSGGRFQLVLLLDDIHPYNQSHLKLQSFPPDTVNSSSSNHPREALSVRWNPDVHRSLETEVDH